MICLFQIVFDTQSPPASKCRPFVLRKSYSGLYRIRRYPPRSSQAVATGHRKTWPCKKELAREFRRQAVNRCLWKSFRIILIFVASLLIHYGFRKMADGNAQIHAASSMKESIHSASTETAFPGDTWTGYLDSCLNKAFGKTNRTVSRIRLSHSPGTARHSKLSSRRLLERLETGRSLQVPHGTGIRSLLLLFCATFCAAGAHS